MRLTIRIAGSRGIPANHGGFETFCERLSQGLLEKGWNVSVYCQEQTAGPVRTDSWNGIERVTIPVSFRGPVSTIVFDWKCIWHARRKRDPVLILGYNTGIFAVVLRLLRVPVIFNMDGVEWQRAKWSLYAKVWLKINEIAACYIGNQLIADHPGIAAMLRKQVSSEKIVTIPYGAEAVLAADVRHIEAFDLKSKCYALVVARGEPENSILEIIRAFVSKRRSVSLVVLGNYRPNANDYHRRVMDAANDQVRFLGPIFDREIVNALRFHARLYIHGHQVGGTNPSLVESIAAANPVLAHDNKFNRWCAGKEARYFNGEDSCSRLLDEILDDHDTLARMSAGSSSRFRESFQAANELQAYEQTLRKWVSN